MPITASILYDLVCCPQRVALDAFGDPADRDEINAFVRLLWERGTLFERETIAKLQLPFVDLFKADKDDRERLTLEAMARSERLIYGGRISAGDLVGMPDLLRKETGGYVPGDIKSGRGEEGGDDDHDGKPKLHYAVQLALYLDILERLNLSAGRSNDLGKGCCHRCVRDTDKHRRLGQRRLDGRLGLKLSNTIRGTCHLFVGYKVHELISALGWMNLT